MADELIRMMAPMLVLAVLVVCVFVQLAFKDAIDEWEWEDRQLQILSRRQTDVEALLSRVRNAEQRGENGSGPKTQAM